FEAPSRCSSKRIRIPRCGHLKHIHLLPAKNRLQFAGQNFRLFFGFSQFVLLTCAQIFSRSQLAEAAMYRQFSPSALKTRSYLTNTAYESRHEDGWDKRSQTNGYVLAS